MRIPKELYGAIGERHASGQSDQAIALWLATLDPPIKVTRVAVMQTRQRMSAGESFTPPPDPKSSEAHSTKPSGAANRKRQAAERAHEAEQHKDRGGVILDIPFDGDVMRSHLYELQIQLELQRQVAADQFMTLPDKVRFCTQIGQTIARLRVDAEIEAEQEAIRSDRARELAEMQEQEQELEREKKRLMALRRELEERIQGTKKAS